MHLTHVRLLGKTSGVCANRNVADSSSTAIRGIPDPFSFGDEWLLVCCIISDTFWQRGGSNVADAEADNPGEHSNVFGLSPAGKLSVALQTERQESKQSTELELS